MTDEQLQHIGELAQVLIHETMDRPEPGDMEGVYLAFGIAARALLQMNSDEPVTAGRAAHALDTFLHGFNQQTTIVHVDREDKERMIIQRVRPDKPH